MHSYTQNVTIFFILFTFYPYARPFDQQFTTHLLQNFALYRLNSMASETLNKKQNIKIQNIK